MLLAGPAGSVQLEDCHLDVGAEQWRSVAVEGTRKMVGRPSISP